MWSLNERITSETRFVQDPAMSEESGSAGGESKSTADEVKPPVAEKSAPAVEPPPSTEAASKLVKATSKPHSRRNFVKAAIIGGASAAAVGAGWTFLLSPRLMPSLLPQTPYGTYVIWFDAAAGVFRRRNVSTGKDEVASADGGRIVQDAIGSLSAPTGGEIWLSSTVHLPSSVITIDRDNVSLIALRDPPPRFWDNPRPHVQKIVYTGNVNGGLLQGIHCREITFDGTGNQQMVVLRDIGMHPTGAANQQGLQFLGSAGYIQYLEIENLKVILSGTDPTAITLGNSNSGSGHFAFTGITSVEAEYDATGTPAVIKLLPGAETGTPIRVDNLSMVDLPSRTTGNSLRPIWLQAQSEPSKGLRQMHIGRMFFEQHYTSPHTLVTIEPATGLGACWFGLTIDELSISDEQGKTVILIDNGNTSWMAREQYLRVKGGVKGGVGTFSLGNLGLHQYFRVNLGDMDGVTPFGKLATPFLESSPVAFVGPGGTAAAPTPTSEYTVAVRPVTVTSDQPWTLKDSNGAVIETVPLGESRFVPLGYRIQFPTGTPSIFG
jgi:hypothetical protein